jgi:hypothetical protein
MSTDGALTINWPSAWLLASCRSIRREICQFDDVDTLDKSLTASLRRTLPSGQMNGWCSTVFDAEWEHWPRIRQPRLSDLLETILTAKKETLSAHQTINLLSIFYGFF